ncbi:threonylcarbamoyl-AMP synthase [Putridiphycobacter roseus]|uniref:Threonylcarbamoyl-AMP synthase n=1 Tax=Putridiphycobacter roseus TaxID=2219161 RepID=A0A2W1N2X5_9FLAO|nr:L-threonylcarbamoyladenylate synthase [Putridiphycobacter roseus]PZE17351.1 threonylcarbamoyl-AMP synthase [Putridiphycobacter roseus]
MIFIVHPDNPDARKISLIVDILKKGGIIIYPTDTVYAIGCSLNFKRSIEKLAQLKGLKTKKTNFSVIFHDLSELTNYTKPIDRSTFKLLNKNLPGPFTFILNASNQVPKLFDTNKKTIGIRIPDNNIVLAIVEALGTPLVTTSLHDEDEIIEYTTDPYLIEEKWANKVDGIVDGGYGKNEPSTVVDLSAGYPEILRQGIGELME